jgi:hypothetical protein
MRFCRREIESLGAVASGQSKMTTSKTLCGHVKKPGSFTTITGVWFGHNM